jgi:hypothetical protein
MTANHYLWGDPLRTIAISGLVALATLLGAATAVPALASAAPAALPPVEELFGVSCLSATNCVGVGVNQNAFDGAGGPLAEFWNGTAWHTVAVKLPAGATTGSLGGVSCLSASDCIAVGSFGKGPVELFALAETWNGRTWKPAALPAPAGVDTGLDGITCRSAASCVAVGTYTANPPSGAAGMPVADAWNGHKWTESRPPVPAGTLVSALDGVSCPSASRCMASGDYDTLGGGSALLESWNGRSWTRLNAAVPAGGEDASLPGVSCASVDSCVANGFVSLNGLISLTDVWNGKRWTRTTVPWPKGTGSQQLPGVSCTATNRCVAVGTTGANLKAASNTGRAAAAVWNGKGWTVTKVPAPAKGWESLFNDVTCLSATDCVAVGETGPYRSVVGMGLSGFWNGSSWRLVTAAF